MIRHTAVSALALCAMMNPAFADVTPQQVWDDLKTYISGFGYEVTGTESMAGNALTVSDVALSIKVEETDGSVSMQLDQVVFTDQGDGSVAITLPPVMPILADFTAEEDNEHVVMRMEYLQDGLEMVVSGDPDALIYDYSAKEMAVTIADMVVDGEPVPSDVFRMDVAMGPVTGRSATVQEDGIKSIAQEMSLGEISYDIAFNDPDSDDSGLFVGRMAEVTLDGSSDIPNNLDITDMGAAFAAGFGGGGTFRHSGGNTEFAVNDGGDVVNGRFRSSGGNLAVEMDGSALRYALGGEGVDMTMTVPDVPFPVTAQMEQTQFDILVPLQPGDGPQEANLLVTLAGFQMAELLWSMVDPGAALPRDPATIKLDMSAMVTPFISLFDEEAMTQLEQGAIAPGELNSVTLNTLLVEAVGGMIAGDGAFTFDNKDTESFDGFPRPEGTLNVSVSGANGLIDKLIGMGLMGDQDAMGARMMLSMFTVPGSAPDTATSKIEINGEGHILANGQRIR